MMDNNISVTRLDTGDIAYIRYEQTDDYPRLADRLRVTAYDQARDLAHYCGQSLGEKIELLNHARAGLTDEEEALLDNIVDASHRAHMALLETSHALQKWNQLVGRKALNERIAQQTQQRQQRQQSNEQAS